MLAYTFTDVSPGVAALLDDVRRVLPPTGLPRLLLAVPLGERRRVRYNQGSKTEAHRLGTTVT